MGLTKRRDSYYVEFRVVDDGEALRLANGGEDNLSAGRSVHLIKQERSNKSLY